VSKGTKLPKVLEVVIAIHLWKVTHTFCLLIKLLRSFWSSYESENHKHHWRKEANIPKPNLMKVNHMVFLSCLWLILESL